MEKENEKMALGTKVKLMKRLEQAAEAFFSGERWYFVSAVTRSHREGR